MSITYNFSDKTVLITGASRGIGLGIAKAFREAGATVHITGTREKPSDYKEDLTAYTYHQCRMGNEDDHDALSQTISDLDVLVNNAGAPGPNEFNSDVVAQVFDVNLVAAADLSYRFRDQLAERKGAIINIASIGGFIGMRDFPAYSASKHALIGFTKSLADKWTKFGVRVNAIAPGFIETRGIDWARQNEAVEKGILATIPMRRFGQTEEVAHTALFLASDNTTYICGHTLVVDGGYLLR